VLTLAAVARCMAVPVDVVATFRCSSRRPTPPPGNILALNKTNMFKHVCLHSSVLASCDGRTDGRTDSRESMHKRWISIYRKAFTTDGKRGSAITSLNSPPGSTLQWGVGRGLICRARIVWVNFKWTESTGLTKKHEKNEGDEITWTTFYQQYQNYTLGGFTFPLKPEL